MDLSDRRLIVIACLAVAVLSIAAASGEAVNRVTNGGFEGSSGPGNWRGTGNFYGSGPKGKEERGIISENPRTGHKCFRVVGEAGRTFQLITYPIPVKPGDRVRADFAVRTAYPALLPQAVACALRFRGKERDLGQYAMRIRRIPDSAASWIMFSDAVREEEVGEYFGKPDAPFRKPLLANRLRPGEFVVPDGVDDVRLYLKVSGRTAVCFDDVALWVTPGPGSKIAASAGAAVPVQTKDADTRDAPKRTLDTLDRQEYQRLLFETGKHVETPAKVPGWTCRVVDPQLPDVPVPETRYPRRSTDLTIRNGLFHRGIRPTFVFHWEQPDIFDYWFFHAAGFDLAQIKDVYLANLMRVDVDKENKEIVVRTIDHPIATYMVPLTLDAGVVAYIQPPENNYPQTYRKILRRNPRNTRWTHGTAIYRYFPEMFVTQGHFISFRPGHPDAERIRENQWKMLLNRTSSFPVFAYETFNELYYRDWSFENVRRFQKRLRKKFPSLADLNTSLNTNFASWDAVVPPRSGAGSRSHIDVREQPNFSPGLWAEWVQVTEGAAGAFLVRLKNFVKEQHPRAYVTVQPRPSADFDGELVGTDIHQIIETHDLYAHEYSSVWLRDVSGRDAEVPFLRRMVQSRIRLESAKVAAEVMKKPILNAEGSIIGGTVIGDETLRSMILANLDGTWKFGQDPEDRGLQLDPPYSAPGFDDGAWKEITVPGVWKEQGYKDYEKPAWYRRRFTIPGDYDGPVWLCGHTLSDLATVFLNGVPVHKTRRWSEQFDVEVTEHIRRGATNTVAVRLEVGAGGIGGIRKYLHVTRGPLKPGALRPEQLRAGVWSSLIHGSDGESFSYEAPRGRHNAFFHPARTTAEAVAEIPFVTAEIKALEPIVMPKPRFPTQVGVVLSYDTKLEIVNRTVNELLARPYSHALADYFGPALWSGLGTELVTDEMLRRGRWKHYRVIVLPLAWRVHPRTLEALESFVEQGGVLVVGAGSMLKDHETNRPLTLPPFVGVQWGDKRTETFRVRSRWRAMAGGGFEAATFVLDGTAGRFLTPAQKTEVLAVDEQGGPVLTRRRNAAGGAVYVLGSHIDIPAFAKFLTALASEEHLRPQLAIETVTGPETRYVERQVLGGQGRFVWHIQEFGGARRTVRVRPDGFKTPEGVYTVRNTKRFTTAPSPAGKPVWNSEEIAAGIPVVLDGQEPVVLLIEGAPLKPTPAYAAALARQRHAFLLHNFQPSPKRDKIAFIPSTTQFYDIDTLPTARLLLEEMGFQVDAGMKAGLTGTLRAFGDRSYPLNRVDLLLLTGPRRVRERDAAAVRKYIENGGRAIVTGVPVWGNWWYHNYSSATRVLRKWGVTVPENTLLEPSQPSLLDRVRPTYEVKEASHPILSGVRRVCMALTPSIDVSKWKDGEGRRCHVLVESSEASTDLRGREGAAHNGRRPLAVALEIGRGRIVLLGSAGCFQPESLRGADNARFFVNAVNWLMQGACRPIREDKIRECTVVPGREEYVKR